MESGSGSEQALEKYDDGIMGIMAGDLDSLLEMFEKAETSLSSSAATCLPLTLSKTLCGSEEDNMTELSDKSCISCEVLSGGVANLSCQSSETLARNEGSMDAQEVFGGENVDCSMQDDENPHRRTFSGNFKREHLSTNTSFEKWETISSSSRISCSLTDAKDAATGFMHEDKARPPVAETFSSSPVGVSSPPKKDDSESSSEWDDDFPSDDKCTDSSSGPDTPRRGHGLTVRRDGPRRQQGRGRVKPVEEEKLYDRLPSYYTVFSRPNRMATGLARSTRSCLQLVLKSELPSADLDSSPNSCGQVFDKVPAYQSCFTNSMRYDETESLDCEKALCVNENACYGRGHGSTATYLHTRPRFRSRSRLRAEVGPRNRRSGRAALSTFDVTDTARPGTSSNPDNPLQVQHRRILYIGRIPATLTAEGLKAAFEIFGEIEKCTVHFRECGDNYGFVTYANTRDAYSAVEGGTGLPGCENFDICFGGRRNFCKADYFDLDGNAEMEEDFAPVISKMKQKENFDDLLMDELLKRKLQ